MVEKILAAILLLVEPGYSELSRVTLQNCNEHCQKITVQLSGKAVKENYRSYGAVWSGVTRAETRVEAIQRFTHISIALTRVALDPPTSWVWDRDELWRGIVTIARHESAFWRSVHEGKIRGKAGEWCLAQIHPSVLPVLGLNGPDLVGLDIEHTENCFRVAVDLLARARNLCDGHPGHWWPLTIQVYGRGHGCGVSEQWVRARVGTYHHIVNNRWRGLSPEARIVSHFEIETYGRPALDFCGSRGCQYAENR